MPITEQRPVALVTGSTSGIGEGIARRLAADCVAATGRPDVLVDNAGISTVIAHQDLDAATPAVWRELLDVDLVAPWIVTTAAVPCLRDSAEAGGPGAIVNITSHAGVRPKGASIPYAATKAALGHVPTLLAAALGPDVRVNAIAPGLVDTPLSAEWTAVQDHWWANALMRRAVQPEDVADLTSSLIANR